jgi:acetate kinase
MNDYALVLNAGSSSLKFSVFERSEAEHWHLALRGQIGGIGTSPRLIVKNGEGKMLADQKPDVDVHEGGDALNALAAWLRSTYGDAKVVGVGHRVVHGGAQFTGPTVVNPQVIAELKRLIPLAPLHQPYNVAAIETVFERLPHVPQVACFDTSFHRGQPAVAELIPLPREICREGVQRYGFHGLSYEYIASVLPTLAPEIARGRVVVAHLGSGASLCAIKDGKVSTAVSGSPRLTGFAWERGQAL